MDFPPGRFFRTVWYNIPFFSTSGKHKFIHSAPKSRARLPGRKKAAYPMQISGFAQASRSSRSAPKRSAARRRRTRRKAPSRASWSAFLWMTKNQAASFKSASPVLLLYPDMPLWGLGHRLMLNQSLDDTPMCEAAAKQERTGTASCLLWRALQVFTYKYI